MKAITIFFTLARLNQSIKYILKGATKLKKQSTRTMSTLFCCLTSYQFVTFSPWKVPWNWIAFYQNSFLISPGLFYHLIRHDTGWLENQVFTPNPIVSSKQQLKGLKITNWYIVTPFLDFFVANMLFFGREETYMFLTHPVFTCSKWTMNTIDETMEYVQS